MTIGSTIKLSQSMTSLEVLFYQARPFIIDFAVQLPLQFLWTTPILIKMTYSWQLDSTISTLGRSSGFLDVKVPKLSAGGFDNANLVRSRVVSGHQISQSPLASNEPLLLTDCDVCTSICWNPSCRLLLR